MFLVCVFLLFNRLCLLSFLVVLNYTWYFFKCTLLVIAFLFVPNRCGMPFVFFKYPLIPSLAWNLSLYMFKYLCSVNLLTISYFKGVILSVMVL